MPSTSSPGIKRDYYASGSSSSSNSSASCTPSPSPATTIATLAAAAAAAAAINTNNQSISPPQTQLGMINQLHQQFHTNPNSILATDSSRTQQQQQQQQQQQLIDVSTAAANQLLAVQQQQATQQLVANKMSDPDFVHVLLQFQFQLAQALLQLQPPVAPQNQEDPVDLSVQQQEEQAQQQQLALQQFQLLNQHQQQHQQQQQLLTTLHQHHQQQTQTNGLHQHHHHHLHNNNQSNNNQTNHHHQPQTQQHQALQQTHRHHNHNHHHHHLLSGHHHHSSIQTQQQLLATKGFNPMAVVVGSGQQTEILTPTHLRKAKLMFFYVRYPNSSTLKECFRDVKFNKNNTAQLVKWFSNFREFYYIQMEKFAREAVLDDNIQCKEDIVVHPEHDLLNQLNNHYNKNRHIDLPAVFRDVVEATLRHFFDAIQNRRDQEQSWKKAIYKIIARMDEDVPEVFKTDAFNEHLE